MEIKPVSIVTIKNKLPLYKKEEEASNIELILLEEVGFELVAQKGLYEIGERAIYIQPDYNLSDITLFESFIRPNGDESKSMLGKIEGKPRRIRAKKFNFSKVPNGEVVYSNGILLPEYEVTNYLSKEYKFHAWDGILDRDLTKELGITKYEEPDTNKGGLKLGASSQFPEGVYKTDETNIYNKIGRIEFPITLIGTEKIDGSSITIGLKNGKEFICSRNMNKPLSYYKCVGYRKKTLMEKLLFWKKPDLKIYKLVFNNQDDFVKYGYEYLNTLSFLSNFNPEYKNIILRGELNGGSMKGSGNKNNPSKKDPVNIKFFGADIWNGHEAVKMPMNEFFELCSRLKFNTVKKVFEKEFNSFEEIIQECNNYFKDNLIEGIVVRSLDSKFSAKVMSLEYDSKK